MGALPSPLHYLYLYCVHGFSRGFAYCCNYRREHNYSGCRSSPVHWRRNGAAVGHRSL